MKNKKAALNAAFLCSGQTVSCVHMNVKERRSEDKIRMTNLLVLSR